MRSPVYRRYTAIRQICYNSNNTDYPNVGGRGIGCYWDNSRDFSNYVLSELGPPPMGSRSQLLRKNLDRDYEPGNLYWGDPFDRSRSLSRTIKVKYRNRLVTFHELSKLTGINKHTLSKRYHNGWSVKLMTTTPPHNGNRLSKDGKKII